jgi:hypothetical protein
VEDSHLKKLPKGTTLIVTSVRVDVRLAETGFVARKGEGVYDPEVLGSSTKKSRCRTK